MKNIFFGREIVAVLHGYLSRNHLTSIVLILENNFVKIYEDQEKYCINFPGYSAKFCGKKISYVKSWNDLPSRKNYR